MQEALTDSFKREKKKDYVFSTRLNEQQMAELDRAGGALWIRAMIEARIAALKAKKGGRA
jgi:hypothetical protein